MPGIVGIVDPKCNPKIDSLLKGMVTKLRFKESYTISQWTACDQRVAVGEVGLEHSEAKNKIFVSHEGKRIATISGDLYSSASGMSYLNCAEQVAKAYEAHGDRFINALNGSFVVMVVDLEKGLLLVGNDRYGTQPLYYATLSGKLLLSSAVKAILADETFNKAVNEEAISDFFSFGHVLGEKTLFKDVSLLPAASILRCDLQTARFSIHSYWDLVDQFRPNGYQESEVLEELSSSFQRAIERRITPQQETALALSGGKDSRAILAALSRSPQKFLTYTLGQPGCQDQCIADELSQIVGREHHALIIADQYLSDFMGNLRKMVALTEGMYITHGMTEMIVIDFLEANKVRHLFRGHGGEIARSGCAWPYQVNQEVRDISDPGALNDYILRKSNYVTHGIELSEVFSEQFYSSVKGLRKRSLKEATKPVIRELSPADVLTYLYIHEHERRYTYASLEIFRHWANISLPFEDYDFLDILLRAPSHMRFDARIHQHLIQKNNARLLKVMDSNTGAPMDAGRLRSFISDKANTVLKRLNVRGFRHYHSFGDWMRVKLADHVLQLLQEDRTRERHYYNHKKVLNLVEQHRRGKADFSYLIEVIMVLELWHREFVD